MVCWSVNAIYGTDDDPIFCGWGDTRQEVLISQGKDIVIDNCKVKSGYLVCPYTGKIFTNPRKMDTDHIVPLFNVYLTGGKDWSEEKKETFANDLENLFVVDASTNREKGADGPELWKPPLKSFWKEYARRWIYIKEKYSLSYKPGELKALGEMLNTP